MTVRFPEYVLFKTIIIKWNNTDSSLCKKLSEGYPEGFP